MQFGLRSRRAGQVRGALRQGSKMTESYAETRPIRVLLVDDHRLLTGALSQMRGREPDIIVAGVAGSVAEAKGMARERLEVVLMDYRLPDGTGAEATRAIKARWPAARVVMLTALTDDETVLESIQAGADGYLTKDRAIDEAVSYTHLRAHETRHDLVCR